MLPGWGFRPGARGLRCRASPRQIDGSRKLDRADGETDQPAGIERRGIKPTRNGRRDERGRRHCGRTYIQERRKPLAARPARVGNAAVLAGHRNTLIVKQLVGKFLKFCLKARARNIDSRNGGCRK